MHVDLTIEILDILDIFWDDLAYDKRTKITYGDLIHSLLEYRSMKACAEHIGVSERTLERILPLSLGILLKKDSKNSTKWNFLLLALIDIRPCWSCNQYKSISTEWYYNDRVCCISCQNSNKREHRNKFPEVYSERSHIHYINNKHDYILRSSKRRNLLKIATPKWADIDKIKEIYSSCPKGYHVDHIIPLQGELVCGLHVENNLQHLPAKDNLTKSNSYE